MWAKPNSVTALLSPPPTVGPLDAEKIAVAVLLYVFTMAFPTSPLCLGPIQTSLEALLGFLVKTKMKAYTKLTVVMCCQIVARNSIASSSGYFRRRPPPRYAFGQDQEF